LNNTLLSTPRLILRDMTPADREEVLTWASDSDEIAFMGWPGLHSPEETREALEWLDAYPAPEEAFERPLAVALKDGALVGYCDLYQRGPDLGVLAWLLKPEERGKGYATEALEAFCASAFQDLPWLQMLTAPIRPDNPRSIALAKRLGFELEVRKGWSTPSGGQQSARMLLYCRPRQAAALNTPKI
jgi:RimJ/RimL family protein N-acetyltransferase